MSRTGSRKASLSYHLTSPSGAPIFDRYAGESSAEGLNWNQLKGIEKFRREILQRVEFPFWKVLTYWSGTSLRALTWDPMIWVTVLIFCMVRIQCRTGERDAAMLEQLSDSHIEVLGGFISFFLVLFVNQTNTRYYDMYGFSKASAGRIQDVAGLAAASFPPASAHRIVRYANAAHVAGYVGLGGPYTQKNFFDHYNQKHKLLTDAELVTLMVKNESMDSGSAILKELITWLQKDVDLAFKAGHIDTHQVVQFHHKILDFRAAMDGIYDFTDQPTPFFYIHFICLLTAFYLPLFAVDSAYSAGWGDEAHWGTEILVLMILLLLCVFVVGLRILGQRMIDPFGMDLEDLSVLTYVTTTIENCRIILASRKADTVNEALENQLMKSINLEDSNCSSRNVEF